MAVCECCGAKITAAAMRDEIRNKSQILADAVEFLGRHPGKISTSLEIAAFIYRDRRCGGPSEASVCVSLMFKRYHAFLRSVGISVCVIKGRNGGYKISSQEVAA